MLGVTGILCSHKKLQSHVMCIMFYSLSHKFVKQLVHTMLQAVILPVIAAYYPLFPNINVESVVTLFYSFFTFFINYALLNDRILLLMIYLYSSMIMFSHLLPHFDAIKNEQNNFVLPECFVFDALYLTSIYTERV